MRGRRYHELLYKKLLIDIGFSQGTSYKPLMDVFWDVSGCGLMEIGQDFYPYVMVEWKLEEGKEIILYELKGCMGIARLFYVQFGGNAHQSAFKKYQPNWILRYGVGRKPKVKGHDMVGGILSRFTLKHWDVREIFIWNIGPIGIMEDKIVD